MEKLGELCGIGQGAEGKVRSVLPRERCYYCMPDSMSVLVFPAFAPCYAADMNTWVIGRNRYCTDAEGGTHIEPCDAFGQDEWVDKQNIF